MTHIWQPGQAGQRLTAAQAR